MSRLASMTGGISDPGLWERLSDTDRNKDGAAAIAEIARVNACWSAAMGQIRLYQKLSPYRSWSLLTPRDALSKPSTDGATT